MFTLPPIPFTYVKFLQCFLFNLCTFSHVFFVFCVFFFSFACQRQATQVVAPLLIRHGARRGAAAWQVRRLHYTLVSSGFGSARICLSAAMKYNEWCHETSGSLSETHASVCLAVYLVPHPSNPDWGAHGTRYNCQWGVWSSQRP